LGTKAGEWMLVKGLIRGDLVEEDAEGIEFYLTY
jgi:hypothetical protein